MKILYFKFFIIVSTCFIITEQQNSTERAQPGRRDSNVMNAIQQVQLQLNSLETEGQRHSAKIQDILRATTRLESQRQEFIGILDRSESHISQRRAFIFLLQVMDLMHVTSHPPTRDLPEAAIGQS
ncbi:hypothetical protein AVEN_48703-1 [Araneus ventricosus]|uniref:Uncharacterized protein n=1 Tax=Araneus ventricosus TaxID=182803 RepID=A0A4Y2RS65_ARAVE|nr:hypothetical protein AVEN_48703-1 [Araneus ventricosus]